jgi:hypothetical protein
MDIPYDSAFVLAGASALPSAPSFHNAQTHETLHLQHQKVQESIPVQGLSVAAGGKREISKQQWEKMKPLIQRVYIKENRPFRHLKNILRAEYGVEPTYGSLPYHPVVDIILLEGRLMRNDSGHQFSRRVTEWGLRKNISCSERRKMLQNPRTLSNPILETQDQRVNSGKLQNWRKRYRKEKPALSLPLNTPENTCKSSLNFEVISADEIYRFQSIQLLDFIQRKETILLRDRIIRALSLLLFRTFLLPKRKLTLVSQYWTPLRVVISGHLVGPQSMYQDPLDYPAFSQL